MAFVVLVIDVPSQDIANLNAKLVRPGKPSDGINTLVNLLAGCSAKNPGADIQLTTRDSAPAISTSGTGSTQLTYSNK